MEFDVNGSFSVIMVVQRFMCSSVLTDFQVGGD